MAELLKVLFASATGGSVLLFAQFLISRRDLKKEKRDGFDEKLSKLSAGIDAMRDDMDRRLDDMESRLGGKIEEVARAVLRVELVQQMQHSPNNTDTILRIAQRYFVDYKGDWYVHSEFGRWCERQGVPLPSWGRAYDGADK